MLRRHLGLPVYDDTARPLRCAECTEPMDAGGDHGSDLCKKGLGWNNRHSAVVRIFGRDVFRAAGAGTSYEVPYLVPGLNLRPADILVHPFPLLAAMYRQETRRTMLPSRRPLQQGLSTRLPPVHAL